MSARCAWYAGVFLLAFPCPTSRAAAIDADDSRWFPSERWITESAFEMRVAEARPWGELPVRLRRGEASLALHDVLRLEVAALAWSAAVARGQELGLDLGVRRRRFAVHGGASLHQVRIGEGTVHGALWPRLVLVARLREPTNPTIVTARWSPSTDLPPGEAWSWSVVMTIAAARVALERGPDRWGTGAVWHRSLAVAVGSSLTFGVATGADDLRVILDLAAAPWRLRVATVIDGPRAGARAVEIGWSR